MMTQSNDLNDPPPAAQSAEDLNLPSNAAERKRVLNVLAQRRYRESSEDGRSKICSYF